MKYKIWSHILVKKFTNKRTCLYFLRINPVYTSTCDESSRLWRIFYRRILLNFRMKAEMESLVVASTSFVRERFLITCPITRYTRNHKIAVARFHLRVDWIHTGYCAVEYLMYFNRSSFVLIYNSFVESV